MRLPEVTYDTLNPEQKNAYDIIVGTRKSGLGGPFSVLVRTPHLAGPANDLHNAFRLDGKLERRIFEMLVIMVARERGTEFAWAVHEQLAIKAGLDVAIIAAIRDRRVPSFVRDDERLMFELVTQLLTTGTLNGPAYRDGLAGLGSDLLIETVAAVGFYSMICLVLNTFQVAAPGGAQPFAEMADSRD